MSIEKIDQNRFFELLTAEGYTVPVLFDLIESGNAESSDVLTFNAVLRRIKEDYGMKVFDMLVCFEGMFSDYVKIIELLDGKTKKIMEEEIEKTYYIKKKKSKFEELK